MNETEYQNPGHKLLMICAVLMKMKFRLYYFTGDISKKTMSDAKDLDLHLLYKPVRMETLRNTIEEILGIEPASSG